MTRYTTRVELHFTEHDSSEYSILHMEMENEGFSRTISTIDGKIYQLPPAEYTIDTIESIKSVLTRAKRAAAKSRKKYSVLVTESKGRTWYNLIEVE